MEQYLNYILMIKNHNILENLIIFLSQLKTFMKSFIQKRQTSKIVIAERFGKISNKRKSQIKNFTIVRERLF